MDQVGKRNTVEYRDNGMVEQNQIPGEEVAMLILLMYWATDGVFGDEFVRFYIIRVHS